MFDLPEESSPPYPFGFEKAEESPGLLLWQTTMIWQRQIRQALEGSGVSHAQFVVLATLLWFEIHQEEATQSRVIHQTKLDKMTVSKALEKLGKAGQVKRLEHGEDGRAKVARLTESGRQMTQTLVLTVEAIDRQFFGKVPLLDQKHLIQILSGLIA